MPRNKYRKTTAEKTTFKKRCVNDHHMPMEELFIKFKELTNRKEFKDLPSPKVCIETDKNYHEEPVFTHSASILLPNYQQEKIKTVKDTCSSKTCEECIEVVPQQSDEWNVTVTDRDKTATSFKSRNTNDILINGCEALYSSALYLSLFLRSSKKDHVSLMTNLKLYQLSLNETDEILLKVNRNDREYLNVQVYNDILLYRSSLTKFIHHCDYVGLLMVIIQQVKELRNVISLLVKLCDGLVLPTESDWWRLKPVAHKDFASWELLFAVCHPKRQIVCADKKRMDRNLSQDSKTIPDDDYIDLWQDLFALHTEKLELEKILDGDYDKQFMNRPRTYDAKDNNNATENDSLLSSATESLFTSSCSEDSSLVSTNDSMDENCIEFPFPEFNLTNYASITDVNVCETSYQDIHAENAYNGKEDKKSSPVLENVENIILTNQGNEFRVDSNKESDSSQRKQI
ncbi:unnamed protein product [Mytilus edulis]|uniref:Uncharacterized protein n=1 Tax=Mytilus edulis TaxID=6550 RepID=A0A8S3T8R1_MYTED|nr:unnamed protein product [Mytilus edulis]